MRHPFFLFTLPLATVFSFTYFTVARAQITPDNSLGAESSVVAPNVEIKGIPSDRIDGGAIRGDNLFHSFQQFNINAGRGAYFSNPAGIANILTRVTGGNVSNIQGVLGVLGKANLFLINPNGIIFGPNARLDVGGSFLGSTANSLLFKNGFEFSATNPQAPPLLTINVPIGLGFRNNPQNITSQSTNLAVGQGNSLTLVGGNVSLNGGSLQAPNGRIELAGVAGTGTVGLLGSANNLNLNFSDNLQRADVSLGNTAKVDVTDRSAGNVIVTARNLNLSGQSSISAGIGQGLTADTQQPGDVNLNLTGALKVNQDSRINNVVNIGATGNAGNIKVKATTVDFNGGILRTRTLGNGDAGNIDIQAVGDISINNPTYQTPGNNRELDAKPALDASNYSNDRTVGSGRSGNISLQANGSISLIGQDEQLSNRVISTNSAFGGKEGGSNISLQANRGISFSNAFISSSGFSGDAGNISLQGNEFVSLTNNSSIVTQAYLEGKNSGNITIQSSGPVLLEHTLVNTAVGLPPPTTTYSVLGNAGDINIRGQSVFITDGTEVSSRSLNSGNSGKIVINATDRVEISGTQPLIPKNRDRSQSFTNTTVTTTSERNAGGNAGDITINSRNLRISDKGAVTATTEGKFKGGNININASAVDLTNDGQINVSSSGTGSAGLLTVRANSIKLDNRASINSNTTAKANTTAEQGNIILNSDDVILRRNSNITTNATGTADGGNITINTDNLVAFENSKITANAQQGYGGKVSITTKGNRFLSPNSVISATSERGPQYSGTVQFNTPEIDPSQGLFELTETVIDPAQQVAQNPCIKGFGSTFTITGRGGLPSDPNKILSSDNVRVDLLEPVASTVNSTSATKKQPSQKPPVKQIIPAQGWIYNEKGEVVLVAYDPTKTGLQREQPAPTSNCAAVK